MICADILFQVTWIISSALFERPLEWLPWWEPFSISLHLFPDAKVTCSPLLLFRLSSGKLNKEHFQITFPWVYVLYRQWPLDFYMRKANCKCVQEKGQNQIFSPPSQYSQIKITFFNFPDPRNKFLKWVGQWWSEGSTWCLILLSPEKLILSNPQVP